MLYWVQHKSFVIYWQPFAEYNGVKYQFLFQEIILETPLNGFVYKTKSFSSAAPFSVFAAAAKIKTNKIDGRVAKNK